MNNYVNDQDHKILLRPKEMPWEYILDPESSKSKSTPGHLCTKFHSKI